MQTFSAKRFGIAAAVIALGVAGFTAGCGDDDDADPTSTPVVTATETDGGSAGSVPSSGSVAPDTFLTFEGERYRLVDLQQADLVDESAFEEAGEAAEADIEQEDLTVYRKSGDTDAVYTYAPEIESEVVGEGAPALWYRWELEGEE